MFTHFLHARSGTQKIPLFPRAGPDLNSTNPPPFEVAINLHSNSGDSLRTRGPLWGGASNVFGLLRAAHTARTILKDNGPVTTGRPVPPIRGVTAE
jgi:hypothetical protein